MTITTNIIPTLLFHLLLVLNSYARSGGDCRESERMALLHFKAELIDHLGRLSSWGFLNCCEWKGVVCDNRTNHVVALDLHGDVNSELYQHAAAPLRGKISSSLLQLPHLQYLDLSFNEFYGPIPHQIGNLSALRHLDLSYNYLYFYCMNLDWLSGSSTLQYLDLSYACLEASTTWLQVIYKLPALKELHLSDCQLPAILPTSVTSHNSSESLVVLDLSYNYLGSSVLQKFLNMSSSFTFIGFSGNNLMGRIPNALGNLKLLFHLELSSNNLESSILDGLGNLTSISYLDLSRNQLQGEFPLRTHNSSSLKYLDISLNSLNGQFSNLLTWLQDPVKLEYIDLSDNLLSGSLPNITRFPALKKMNLRNNVLNGAVLEGSVRHSNLEYLDLSMNQFTGISPSNLWLPNLEILDLSTNKFTSRLPNMSSCVSLRVLELFNNTFIGSLTENIRHLPKMKLLHAAHNNIEGVITEAHLSSLPRLTELDLSFNLNITVSISSRWKHPVQFQILNLANCKLGPGFPEWLQTQDQLESLDISHTGILDTIPTWFWNKMHVCRYLNMSHNQIYGVLPDLSFKFKKFYAIIDLSSNEFTGSLPFLPQVPFTINLSRNKFSGKIPNFCKISKNDFSSVDLSNNRLSGEIPQDCFNLDYLDLANNNLSGEIPTTNKFSCNFYSLHLRNNRFRGEIPRSLMNCSYLRVLDLGENVFNGKIPSWLGASMPNLKVLILKSNMFYGSLPSSICRLSNIKVLDVSSNKITGNIPNCVNNFRAMSLLGSFPNYFQHGDSMAPIASAPIASARAESPTSSPSDSASIIWKRNEATFINTLPLLKMIDLSDNELTGVIPQEITSLTGLLGLNLSRNNLFGLIPQHIDQMELLNFLDLSRNNLSGGIPQTFSELNHLGLLDLSFNNLSGRIPWETHMQTFGASTYSGNPGLCGPPLLSRPCPEDVKPTNGSDDSDKLIDRGFYISMLLGFVLAFWVAFWILFFQKWWSVFIMKAYIGVDDWLYVHILVNKRRLMRFFGKD